MSDIAPITYEQYLQMCNTQRQDREQAYRERIASAKVTKHRKTIAPFECVHCGYIWYGWTGMHSYASGQPLCTKCHNDLDNYLFENYGNYYEQPEKKELLQKEAQAWMANRKPRPDSRRFHKSVPKWMRSAILAGMVKTNGKEVYLVYSQEDIAVKVEQVEGHR